MTTRRLHRFVSTLLFLTSACFSTSMLAQSSAVVERKNIDDLSRAELQAYQHAIQFLKDRSMANVYDPEGYLWQAWVHNCPSIVMPLNMDQPLDQQIWPTNLPCDLVGLGGDDTWQRAYDSQRSQVARLMTPAEMASAKVDYPGMCQHHSDVFLQWHRAEFYYFEKLLQATDPNGILPDSTGVAVSTASVGVPYWNFTKPPSGNRYPAIFEDATSPLYIGGRRTSAVDPDNMPYYTSPFLLRYLLDKDWATFGGRPTASESTRVILQEGAYETSIHDAMHFRYIGGPMGSPSTAALDPIFFSFHAFIDMHYEKWLSIAGNDPSHVTSTDRFLRGQQPISLPNPPVFTESAHPSAVRAMGVGDNYLDITQLGYTYGRSLDSEFLTTADVESRLAGEPFSLDRFSPIVRLLRQLPIGEEGAAPVAIVSVDFQLPTSATGSRYIAKLEREIQSQDYSYRQSVYLHPTSVTPIIEQELNQAQIQTPATPSSPYLNRYFADESNYWELGNAHAGHAGGSVHRIALNADITWAIESLSAQHSTTPSIGQNWTLTFSIYSQSTLIDASHFKSPEFVVQ